jgi:hypothetical protein
VRVRSAVCVPDVLKAMRIDNSDVILFPVFHSIILENEYSIKKIL